MVASRRTGVGSRCTISPRRGQAKCSWGWGSSLQTVNSAHGSARGQLNAASESDPPLPAPRHVTGQEDGEGHRTLQGTRTHNTGHTRSQILCPFHLGSLGLTKRNLLRDSLTSHRWESQLLLFLLLDQTYGPGRPYFFGVKYFRSEEPSDFCFLIKGDAVCGPAPSITNPPQLCLP